MRRALREDYAVDTANDADHARSLVRGNQYDVAIVYVKMTPPGTENPAEGQLGEWREQLPAMRLLVVSDGPPGQSVKDYLEQHGIDDMIIDRSMLTPEMLKKTLARVLRPPDDPAVATQRTYIGIVLEVRAGRLDEDFQSRITRLQASFNVHEKLDRRVGEDARRPLDDTRDLRGQFQRDVNTMRRKVNTIRTHEQCDATQKDIDAMLDHYRRALET